MIGIINYGMGNLRSVQKAFERVGASATIVDQPSDVAAMDKLVLPGVGAFADGMKYLGERGFIPEIHDFIKTGKPFLGICLGMQLLFEGSEEDASSPGQLVPGLGVLSGRVVQFRGEPFGAGKLKVPHMGWNEIQKVQNNGIFADVESGDAVYFVHSFFVQADDQNEVAITCDYGGDFCAAAHRGSIWATQFHPEKSQIVGLKMLKCFADM